jgi:putative Holliday junction resolvase
MKILAIDYGTKKIGLAISNEKASIAFPYKIIANDAKVIDILRNIIKEEGVEKVVVGMPRYNHKTNLFFEIENFINDLRAVLEMPIDIYDELLTSEAAHKIKPQKKHSHDLSAMLILEDYLQKYYNDSF